MCKRLWAVFLFRTTNSKAISALKGNAHKMNNKLPKDMFEELNWSVLMESVSDLLNKQHNVNDNVVNILTNNDNVNIDNDSNKVDFIAQKLVTELNNPDARIFYCKVAWKLPEAKIWSNLELAKKGRSPQKYFSWLCKRDMI